MCKNLVEKGNLEKPLIIFNRTVKRATDLQSKLPEGKTVVAQTLEEAVSKASIVFTCLGDDAAVKDTLDSIGAHIKGKLFVDCSTIHPETTTMISKAIQGKGGEFVACPGKFSTVPF